MPKKRKTDAVGISAKYREWLEKKDAMTDDLLSHLSLDVEHRAGSLSASTKRVARSIRSLNAKWDRLNTDDLTSQLKGQS